jgi:hypothetical protein
VTKHGGVNMKGTHSTSEELPDAGSGSARKGTAVKVLNYSTPRQARPGILSLSVSSSNDSSPQKNKVSLS